MFHVSCFMKRLVLIDANALIHRSFHALPPLTTKRGELVNAIYGFISILLRVLKEFRPDFIIAAFDLAEPTFRHLEFEEYKATRPKAPEEIYEQVPKTKEILRAFGIPILEKAGFEADDIIGTVSQKVAKEDIENIIVTGDLDTLQLVNKNVKVYTLKKGITDTVIYDEKAVGNRYGLEVEQLRDFKGLKGDPSDNIPGVPGIGEKTAIGLLKKFGNLENLYKKLEKGEAEGISEKLRAKLLEYKEQAFFSKKLATIREDVPLKFELRDFDWKKNYDRRKIEKLFQELEFHSLIRRLPGEQGGRMTDMTNKQQTTGRKEREYMIIEEVYKEGILSKKVYEIEKNLVPVLREMEQTGIKIDMGQLNKLSKELDLQLKKLEKEIYKLAGIPFNINSPQQLSEILFKKLKISTDGLRKTPGGVLSTAAPELYKLKGKHKIIDLIINYRELVKLKSTYIDALPKLMDPKTGRIHTNYHQLGTVTGRLSSSDPNLQNIPIRGELGQEIRKAFIAEKGYKLISADYSQIELRIAASIANDRKMIEAFKKGKDIHVLTAAEVNNVSESKVTPQMRYQAKALNFGVLYGMSVVGFAEAAGISRERAKDFIKEYMKDFSGIAKYVEKTKKEAKKKGYVETILGRRRYLPQINSSDFRLRQASERMAINMPIQGTAADIIKVAMIEIEKGLESFGEAKMLLQVHDELVFEVKEDKIKEVAEIIKETMEGVLNQPEFKDVKKILRVPPEVNIKVGDNWKDLEEIKI